MLKLLEKALIILSSLNTKKIEDGEEVAVEEVEDEQSKMEGMESIALLLDGSILGHFVQLPKSVYYQMGQSRLFVSTSYLSVKQPTTPTPPSAILLKQLVFLYLDLHSLSLIFSSPKPPSPASKPISSKRPWNL
ncbi:unnamed protein product [Lactuca saligna]|uniref:Uncharacterized protein n=1 Tax=Lactuca saligna TaxID=75948 RepID=A0AA35V235_LACSI|nr:unnamed protein product [Lactuca saligna]